MTKKELRAFVAKKMKINFAEYDDVVCYEKGDLLVVIAIEDEYHTTEVFLKGKKSASLLSQAGGIKHWNKFKLVGGRHQMEE